MIRHFHESAQGSLLLCLHVLLPLPSWSALVSSLMYLNHVPCLWWWQALFLTFSLCSNRICSWHRAWPYDLILASRIWAKVTQETSRLWHYGSDTCSLLSSSPFFWCDWDCGGKRSSSQDQNHKLRLAKKMTEATKSLMILHSILLDCRRKKINYLV